MSLPSALCQIRVAESAHHEVGVVALVKCLGTMGLVVSSHLVL